VQPGIPVLAPEGGTANAKVEEYFLEYYATAVRIALRVLGDFAAAEDTAMDVFSQAPPTPSANEALQR
jgi:hypothetical protein